MVETEAARKVVEKDAKNIPTRRGKKRPGRRPPRRKSQLLATAPLALAESPRREKSGRRGRRMSGQTPLSTLPGPKAVGIKRPGEQAGKTGQQQRKVMKRKVRGRMVKKTN